LKKEETIKKWFENVGVPEYPTLFFYQDSSDKGGSIHPFLAEEYISAFDSFLERNGYRTSLLARLLFERKARDPDRAVITMLMSTEKRRSVLIKLLRCETRLLDAWLYNTIKGASELWAYVKKMPDLATIVAHNNPEWDAEKIEGEIAEDVLRHEEQEKEKVAAVNLKGLSFSSRDKAARVPQTAEASQTTTATNTPTCR
jgi:hypothetical protein